MQVFRDEWQGRTGDSWAAEWRRTDRSFTMLTERLLQRSRDFNFAHVLDIGCGAGELSLALARGRPECRITGVDISPALIEAARTRGEHLPSATFIEADAATWQPDGPSPDLLVSRHGVMFFADPVAAFTHLAEVAAPGAGLLFSCFRDPSHNPFMTEVARLLPPPAEPADPLAPGPFAFADPARVEVILRTAGWTDVAMEPFDFAMIAGAGDDPVAEAMAYFQAIGPAARAQRDLDREQLDSFRQDLRALAERHRSDGIVALRAAAWIVSARRA
ncbi:MAG: methyltransferase domain-containing protein [Croceibacterium sp.]